MFKASAIKLLILLCFCARAPGAPIGLGGESAARVGAMTAHPSNALGTFFNPGLSPLGEETQFSFGVGQAQESFHSLGSVVVDSEEFPTEQGLKRSQDFTPEGGNKLQWFLGFRYPFKISDVRLGFGLALAGPLNQMASFESRSPYDFTSMRYGSGQDPFQINVGLGVGILSSLYWGVGAEFYAESGGASEIWVRGDGQPVGRIRVDVGMQTSLVTGLYADFESTRLGLVYRPAVQPKLEQQATARLALFRDGSGLTLPLLLSTTPFYYPHRFELEGEKDWDSFLVSLGLSYEIWTGYVPPSLKVETGEGGVEGFKPSLQNTLNPRASFAYLWPDWQLSVGYRLRPSPLKQNEETMNLLDAPTHIFGAGLSYTLETDAWSEPLTLNLYAQLHLLEGVSVKKTNPNSIGYPGYEYDGAAWFYGLSLSTAL